MDFGGSTLGNEVSGKIRRTAKSLFERYTMVTNVIEEGAGDYGPRLFNEVHRSRFTMLLFAMNLRRLLPKSDDL